MSDTDMDVNAAIWVDAIIWQALRDMRGGDLWTGHNACYLLCGGYRSRMVEEPGRSPAWYSPDYDAADDDELCGNYRA